jgi:superfamily II DNA/RNA helicase
VIRDRAQLAARSFEVVHDLSCLANAGESDTALQELVLRCLEQREAFDGCGPILDSLVRRVGLFPYLDPGSLGSADRIAYELHRPTPTTEFVFHSEQAEVFRSLLAGRNVVLSAPTSFGKSLIIDALISTRRYTNVLVVVPTIALIDETRQRLSRKFKADYKIITHVSQPQGSHNLFVFTQERAIEKSPDNVDLLVIDEFYKLSPSQNPDDVRWNLLNQLFYRYVKRHTQFYLLGPSVRGLSTAANVPLRFDTIHTQYQTVVSEVHRERGTGGNLAKLVQLCSRLTEPTIIFCSSPNKAAKAAMALIDAGINFGSEETTNAAEWLASHYHAQWHVTKGLRNGIGVHHARIPRAIGQYIVRAFNSEKLRFLVCTSTLIEGVNTKARNVIILDNKINLTPIDFFTFNNIRGRSGRMGTGHFIGHVYIFHDPPEDNLPLVDLPAFMQTDDTPESLLVQLDEDDLTPRSRERVSGLMRSEILSYNTIRANNGVEPAKQISLAREIADNLNSYSANLAWRSYPTSSQVKFICDIMWRFFDGRRLARGSVLSAKQLAFLIERLRAGSNAHDLIVSGIDYESDVDVAIQKVLDFLRLWAEFHFPRLLRVINRIQAEVLTRSGRHAGDYEYFANQVENLFLDHTMLALEEYGIPLEVSRKLVRQLRPEGDLDSVLERLRELDATVLPLTDFEKQLIVDAQESL